MAKEKKKGGRQGIASKVANTLLIVLAFIRPLQIAFHPSPLQSKIDVLVSEATFGLGNRAGSKFDLKGGLRMYSPAGAAIGLGFLKSYIMKKFPVRR